MKKKTNNMKKVKNRAIFQQESNAKTAQQINVLLIISYKRQINHYNRPWSPTAVSARKEDSQKAERKFISCHLLTREGDHQHNTTHTHI